MFVPIRIIDIGDPNMPETLGYFRPEKIIAVRPARHPTNAQDMAREPKTIPIWKKFTALAIDGIGNVPSSDPVDTILMRIKNAMAGIETIPPEVTEKTPVDKK